MRRRFAKKISQKITAAISPPSLREVLRHAFRQVLPGQRALCFYQLRRRTLRHHLAALAAALRPQIDDPIPAADDVLLCSMTITLLPPSTSRSRMARRCAISDMCNPVVGSSIT